MYEMTVLEILKEQFTHAYTYDKIDTILIYVFSICSLIKQTVNLVYLKSDCLLSVSYI